jgi:hypothetical protein
MQSIWMSNAIVRTGDKQHRSPHTSVGIARRFGEQYVTDGTLIASCGSL